MTHGDGRWMERGRTSLGNCLLYTSTVHAYLSTISIEQWPIDCTSRPQTISGHRHRNFVFNISGCFRHNHLHWRRRWESLSDSTGKSRLNNTFQFTNKCISGVLHLHACDRRRILPFSIQRHKIVHFAREESCEGGHNFGPERMQAQILLHDRTPWRVPVYEVGRDLYVQSSNEIRS